MTRRRVIGLTLAELMVSSVLLAFLSGILVSTMRSQVAFSRKMDTISDAERGVALVGAHLRQMVRGAKVTSPVSGSAPTLSFQSTTLEADGSLLVDANGVPVWAAATELSLDGEGRLIAVQAGETKVLARLGKQAEISFERLSPETLQVRVVAEHREERSESSAKRENLFELEVAP